MCANYEPISKDRVHLLDLFEPTFEYKDDVYPGYDCPLIFSNKGNLKWRSVKFGMIPPWNHDPLDNVHTKFGKKKISVGPCYVPSPNWSMRRHKLSRNLFRWSELLIIKQ